jgi:hypothetical protein
MSDAARYQASDQDHGAGDAPSLRPALTDLWSWVEIVLQETPIAQVDDAEGRALCALALEVYAPALVIELDAAGIAADVLLFARIAELYSDRYGAPAGRYTVRRLRTVVRTLRQCSPSVGS